MENTVVEETQQSKIKLLIARGKEEGFLTYEEVKEHLPDTLEPKQIDDIISKIKAIGIKVEEFAPDATDSDAEDIIAMLHDMETIPDADNLVMNTGFVEIRDNSIWIKHIYDCDALKDYLLNLKESSLVMLEIDGDTGRWIKMANGKDGRPTNGIKPIGETKRFWSEMQKRRGDVVSIKKV